MAKKRKRKKRRGCLGRLLTLVLAVALLAAFYNYSNYTIEVEEAEFSSRRLPALFDGYRIVQAVKLANFWFKNCDERTALFATGDYNSLPHSNAQAMLRSLQFQPSQLLAERSDEYATMNFAKTGSYILDYCYVNPSAQAVREYKVVRTHFYVTEAELRQYPRAGYASDHRAIMTYCDYKPFREE